MRIIIFTGFVLLSTVKDAIGLFDSCIHGGMKYGEGEYFLPNNTLIKAEGPQQCVQCRCLQGLVLCEIENCPKLQCEAPLQNPQFCCLHCPGSIQGKEKTSDFVFGKSRMDLNFNRNSKGDCISNGKHFKNGSVWQPVIGPFGVMACVQCRCHERNIVCSRLECGDALCSQPRREFGQCCPVCPTLAENRRKAMCLPKSSELFVFKTPNLWNNSDTIEYAFIENYKQEDDVVKIHMWTLKPKSLDNVFNVSIIPRMEFQRRDFQILGSISKRRFKKYLKREKKLMNHCFDKCFSRVERLKNSLVDYAVNAKNKCAEDEVDVSNVCC